jgi:hypothetical protein
MLGFKIRKELFDVAAFPLPGFLEALPDALVSVHMCGDIEQPLVGLGVLHNCSRFAFNRQDNRALAPLELLHKVARAAAKRSKRLNVFGDVEHKESNFNVSTFLGAFVFGSDVPGGN